MKTTIFFRPAGFFLAIAYLIGAGAVRADASSVPVNDWYALSGNSNAIIVDGETSSPRYENIANRSLGLVYSYFDPVTLSDGEVLTLSFDIALDLDTPEIRFSVLRFGLFKSGSLKASEVLGERRVGVDPAPVDGWSGFLLINPNEPVADNPLTVYRRTAGSGTNYVSTSGTDILQAIAQKSGAYSLAFQSGESRSFTLTFARAGNDLVIDGSCGDCRFSGTLPEAFGEGYGNVFDAFGFYSSEGDTLIRNARFSNVQITRSTDRQP